MSQNYAQSPYGQPLAFPQPMLPGMNPMALQPGMNPALMAAMQQASAGVAPQDDFNLLPSPTGMAIGAVGGMGMGLGLSAMNDAGWFHKLATGIDGFPGVKQVSQWLDENVVSSVAQGKQEWAKELLLTRSLNPELTSEQVVAHAVSAMEQRHLEQMLAHFPKRLSKAEKTAYEELLKKSSSEMRDAYNLLKTQEPLEALNRQLAEKTLDAKAHADEVAKLDRLKLGKNQQFANFADPNQQWFKQAGPMNFENALRHADAQIHYIENELGSKATKAQRRLANSLTSLRERISGKNSHYKPIFEAQAELSAALKRKDVGPIGRMVANGTYYLKRIFNGETLRTSTGTGFMSRIETLGGPAFAGLIILGQSVDKAMKAKPGEKVASFFQDFLGTGIFNFLGWEIGRKALYSTNLGDKLLGRFASKRPFNNFMLRYLPIVGQGFGKGVEKVVSAVPVVGKSMVPGLLGFIAGKGPGGFLARLTLSGLFTEMISMFVVGSLFQKVGEKISHLIFGKPTDPKKEGNAVNPAALLMNPAMNPAALMSASNNGMMSSMPSLAASMPMAGGMSALPGRFNAAGVNPAMAAPMNPNRPMFTLQPNQISQNPAAMQQQQWLRQQLQGQSAS